jgi:hypothetical protein
LRVITTFPLISAPGNGSRIEVEAITDTATRDHILWSYRDCAPVSLTIVAAGAQTASSSRLRSVGDAGRVVALSDREYLDCQRQMKFSQFGAIKVSSPD